MQSQDRHNPLSTTLHYLALLPAAQKFLATIWPLIEILRSLVPDSTDSVLMRFLSDQWASCTQSGGVKISCSFLAFSYKMHVDVRENEYNVHWKLSDCQFRSFFISLPTKTPLNDHAHFINRIQSSCTLSTVSYTHLTLPTNREV